MSSSKIRCVNIDWLEVYCLESNERFPCNAEYFRRQGYLVSEREYGTRVYKEMFTITNEQGDPLIEIRRNPASGTSSFNGLTELSTHIRLPNWMLYQSNPIDFLRDFLIKNDYIFVKIYRIDICYDFEFFDSGDLPARFARRYIERKYRKINQSELTAHAADNWSMFEWQSLSWGSRKSMVSTKMYNKTLELQQADNDKPWIKTCWMFHGLIDNPVSMTRSDGKGGLYKPEIWRIEFSMKADAREWLVIEMNNGKKTRKQAIPHTLSMFDSKDKLWQRFQNLAQNYFRFKHTAYISTSKSVSQFALEQVSSEHERKLQRKDRCPDKILFHFNTNNQYMQLSAAPAMSKPNRNDEILRRRLEEYAARAIDPKQRQAAELILSHIAKLSSLRFVPQGESKEREALQKALSAKLGGDMRSALELIEYFKAILDDKTLF